VQQKPVKGSIITKENIAQKSMGTGPPPVVTKTIVLCDSRTSHCWIDVAIFCVSNWKIGEKRAPVPRCAKPGRGAKKLQSDDFSRYHFLRV
jgi:hypothetical protein